MTITEIVYNEDFQAVKLPKNFYVEGNRIFIKKVKDGFLLMPCKNTMEGMLNGIEMFTDDFMEDGRGEDFFSEREEF